MGIPVDGTHQQLGEQGFEKSGFGSNLVRLLLGIENEQDLLMDLSQIFEKSEISILFD